MEEQKLMVTNPPKTIYLNTQVDYQSDFSELSGITWSFERINDTDIEYILKPIDSLD